MNQNNHPVTKKDLTEILGNVIEQNILPGVQSIINKSHNKLRTEIYDLKQDLKKEFIETGAKNKNEILNSNDKLIRKLVKHDQERAFLGKRVDDNQEKIEKFEPVLKKHEKRITALESQTV
ncbi:MAG: hypothetical protein ABIJ91_03010 [Candidatus Kuenenbacteria bacterium]